MDGRRYKYHDELFCKIIERMASNSGIPSVSLLISQSVR